MDTRKLIEIKVFCKISEIFISQFPINTPKHNDFFNSNFIVAFILLILSKILSEANKRVGNFPALFNPGPSIRGMSLIKEHKGRFEPYLVRNSNNCLYERLYIYFSHTRRVEGYFGSRDRSGKPTEVAVVVRSLLIGNEVCLTTSPLSSCLISPLV